MKCHDCNKRMTRTELKKHVCKPYKSPRMSDKWRAYLKHFGSRPPKK